MSKNKKDSGEILKKYNVYYRKRYISRSMIAATGIALNPLVHRNMPLPPGAG